MQHALRGLRLRRRLSNRSRRDARDRSLATEETHRPVIRRACTTTSLQSPTRDHLRRPTARPFRPSVRESARVRSSLATAPSPLAQHPHREEREASSQGQSLPTRPESRHSKLSVEHAKRSEDWRASKQLAQPGRVDQRGALGCNESSYRDFPDGNGCKNLFSIVITIGAGDDGDNSKNTALVQRFRAIQAVDALGMTNRAFPTKCGAISGDVSRCGQNM